MAIDPLPPAPSLSNPVAFPATADMFVVALETFRQQVNASLGVMGAPDSSRIVDLVATSNVNTATGLAAGQTIDGVTITTGMRILLTAQTTGSQNGIYDAPASGAASRSTDADSEALIPAGLQITATRGSANKGRVFTHITAPGFTLNSTTLVFAQQLNRPLRNCIAGVQLSTAGASATFAVSTGAAADSTNIDMLELLTALSKTTSAWAVGNAGALDTGSIANSTWYHVWLIKRVDTGVVDVLISLSATAPTMPANYTLKRRIGAMRTNGSAQWERFFQDGDNFRWETPVNDYSPQDITSTASGGFDTLVARVPTGVRVRALLNGHCQSNTGASTVSIRAMDEIYAVSSVQAGAMVNSGQTSLATRAGGVLTNTSGQYAVKASNVAGNFYYLYIGTLGWIDRRGKDD